MVEVIVQLVHFAHSLHSLWQLIEAMRSNPQMTISLSIVLLAGVVAAIVIRHTQRPNDSLSIR